MKNLFFALKFNYWGFTVSKIRGCRAKEPREEGIVLVIIRNCR